MAPPEPSEAAGGSRRAPGWISPPVPPERLPRCAAGRSERGGGVNLPRASAARTSTCPARRLAALLPRVPDRRRAVGRSWLVLTLLRLYCQQRRVNVLTLRTDRNVLTGRALPGRKNAGVSYAGGCRELGPRPAPPPSWGRAPGGGGCPGRRNTVRVASLPGPQTVSGMARAGESLTRALTRRPSIERKASSKAKLGGLALRVEHPTTASDDCWLPPCACVGLERLRVISVRPAPIRPTSSAPMPLHLSLYVLSTSQHP